MFRRFRNYPQIRGKKGVIPSGWIELDWIGNGGGGSYIDTGIPATKDVSSKFDISIVNFPVEDVFNGRLLAVYGKGDSWEYNSYGLFFVMQKGQSTLHRLTFHGLNNVLSNVLTEDTRFSVSITANGTNTASVAAYSGGVLSTVSASIKGISSTENFRVLYNSNVTDSVHHMRIHECEFSRNGIILKKFVCVRNVATNDVAMCNVLTGDIYRNQGTGAFVAGPEKAA